MKEKNSIVTLVAIIYPKIVPEETSCCKSFSRASNLKMHIHTVHEGHRDHKCKFCGKSFLRADNLKSHIQKYMKEKILKQK